MRIKEMFSEKRIIFDLKGESKKEILDELIDAMMTDGRITDREAYKDAVLNREKECSTGIGSGIAIPHGMCNEVTEAAIVFGRSKKGIDYASIDGAPVYLFFMIAMPEGECGLHLEVLSELSGRLMDSNIREKLMNAENYEDIIRIFI